ncbi:hypothetical protein QM467_15490 [Rhodoblastus sp. 17X3]|nr:hypothetical protein [Rhodoblastus sp. 17X3]MDI9849459.1 hypothetical protein [Rhodoblastus sp. 17X3]
MIIAFAPVAASNEADPAATPAASILRRETGAEAIFPSFSIIVSFDAP